MNGFCFLFFGFTTTPHQMCSSALLTATAGNFSPHQYRYHHTSVTVAFIFLHGDDLNFKPFMKKMPQYFQLNKLPRHPPSSSTISGHLFIT